MRTLHYIVLSYALLVFASCTVKEDRVACPVFLHFGKIDNPYNCAGDVEVYGFTLQGAAPEFLKRNDLGVFLAGGESVQLSKRSGSVTMLASRGILAGAVDAYAEYRISGGAQMDSIYALNDVFDVVDDDYYVKGGLFRQFAGVTLTIAGLDGAKSQFDVVVRGSGGGFDLRTLSPVEGRLELQLQRDSDDLYRFRLPRQDSDWELTLSLYMEGTVDPIHVVNLSNCLKLASYDWTAPDLAEIVLDVDFARGTVYVTVGNWSGEIDVQTEL